MNEGFTCREREDEDENDDYEYRDVVLRERVGYSASGVGKTPVARYMKILIFFISLIGENNNTNRGQNRKYCSAGGRDGGCGNEYL